MAEPSRKLSTEEVSALMEGPQNWGPQCINYS